MSRICLFTGKKTKSGNTRSHSLVAVKRKFRINLITKRIDLGDGIKVPVRMSAKFYKKAKKDL